MNTTYWLTQRLHIDLDCTLVIRKTALVGSSFRGRYFYDGGDISGSIPDNWANVEYSQKLTVPYMAKAGKYITGRFNFNLAIKYSYYAQLKDSVQHYLRSIHFTDDIKKADYYGIYLDTGYTITSVSKVYLGMSYNNYYEKNGRSHEYISAPGKSRSVSDGSPGISNSNW